MVKRIKFACVALFMISVPILAFTSSSQLVVMPHAVLPSKGAIEYGAVNRFYSEGSAATASETVYFFRHSPVDQMEYNFEIGSDSDAIMSMSAQLFSLQHKELQHRGSVGFMSSGWTLPESGATSVPPIHFFGVYSVSIPKWRSHYHIGVADYKNEDYSVLVAGFHHDFDRFTTMTEWDGRQVHFGIKYKLSDHLRFYTSLTPAPTGEFGTRYNYVNMGISYSRSLTDEASDRAVKIDRDYERLSKQLADMNAKYEAMKEFSSVDFLEEFQEFLLREHLVKEELKEEKKTVVKKALTHMQRGLEHYYSERYDKALLDYQYVVKLMPDFSIGFVRLGSIYYKLGDIASARSAWSRALELDPENFGLKNFLKRISPKEFQSAKEQKKQSIPPDLLEELMDIDRI